MCLGWMDRCAIRQHTQLGVLGDCIVPRRDRAEESAHSWGGTKMFCAVLCHAGSCHAVPYCAMPCHALLRDAVPVRSCWGMLHGHAALYHTVIES